MNVNLSVEGKRGWVLAAMSAVCFSVSQSVVLAADVSPDLGEVTVTESKQDWYVSVFGGGRFIDGDVEYTNGQTVVDTDFDSGYLLGAALGYRWSDYHVGGFVPRTEFEFSFSENDVSSIDFSGNGAGNETVIAGSNVSSVGLLANLYLDAPDALGDGVTPYFGGGLGVNIIDHNLVYNAAGLNLNDNDDSVFAWHVTAGVDFELSENVSFFTDIGYHQAEGAGSVRRIGGNPVPAGPGGGFFEDDISSVVVRGGIKISFDGFQ